MECEAQYCPFATLKYTITASNKRKILELFDDHQVAHILDHLWHDDYDYLSSRRKNHKHREATATPPSSPLAGGAVNNPTTALQQQQTMTSFVPLKTSSASKTVANILHPFPTFAQVAARPPPPPLHPIKRAYAAYFHPDGTHIFPTTLDAHGNRVLPDSRGVFFKNIPPTADLTSIARQLRGGAIERIDYHCGRTTLGVYFVLAVDAARYIKVTRQTLGPATVEAIPRVKGGHEPIKINVAKAIREEGATRVLKVTGLPEDCRGEALVKHVQRQSNQLEIEMESVEWGWTADGRKTCVVRMASIGTALGARLQLRKLKYYRGCEFEFLRDECEGSLEGLRATWVADMKEGHFRANRLRL